MFDIAWSEFLVVAVVALVVVGPRDLPALLRTVGKTVASLRRMAGEFQTQFNDAMREAELDDLKNQVTGLKDAANKAVGASPFQIARDELKNALTDIKAKPAAPSALAGANPEFSKPGEVAQIPSALAPEAPETPPAPSEAEFAKSAVRQAAATETPTPKPDDGAPAAVSDTEPESASSAPAEGDKPASPREPGAAA